MFVWRLVRLVTLLLLMIGLTGVTARAEGAQAQAKMRVVLLGTAAGPILRRDRSQPANLLVVNGVPYLIDAGEGVVRQLLRAGAAADQLRAIFITHHHLDHDAGLVSLIAFIWSEQTRRCTVGNQCPVVTIVGPPGTKEMVEAAFAFLAVPERILDSHSLLPTPQSMFDIHELDRDGLAFKDGNVRVTVAENTHFHFPPNAAATRAGDKSFSYRFDAARRSVVFTGDTGPSKAVTKLAQDADVLVSEINDPIATARYLQKIAHPDPSQAKRALFHTLREHLTGEAVGKMATSAHVGAVILTHIMPGYDGEADMTHYKTGVAKHYKGPIIVGQDLLKYQVLRHH